MKIIDTFIFYNELDLLFYRLFILYDIVDHFIIVESTRTHKGNNKPLFYLENKHKYKQFENKIIHIIVDDLTQDAQHNYALRYEDEVWKNENLQRNNIQKGIEKINMQNNDLIIISDLDEIPDPNTIRYLKNNLRNNDKIGIVSLYQEMYYYSLTCKNANIWYRAKIVSYETYCSRYNKKPQDCRMDETVNKIVEKGGWHLSCFGSAEFIQNKLKNGTHQEYNTETYTNLNTIQEKMKKKEDFLSRSHEKFSYIDIKDNPNLPPKYETLLKDYMW